MACVRWSQKTTMAASCLGAKENQTDGCNGVVLVFSPIKRVAATSVVDDSSRSPASFPFSPTASRSPGSVRGRHSPRVSSCRLMQEETRGESLHAGVHSPRRVTERAARC